MKLLFTISLVFSQLIVQSKTECPSCDMNNYNPVCASGKAFQSLCHMARLECLSKIQLKSKIYGKCGKKRIVVNDDTSYVASKPYFNNKINLIPIYLNSYSRLDRVFYWI